MVSSKLKQVQKFITGLMPGTDKLRHSVFFTLLFLVLQYLGIRVQVAFFMVLGASILLELVQKVTGGKNTAIEIIKDIFWSNLLNFLILILYA